MIDEKNIILHSLKEKLFKSFQEGQFYEKLIDYINSLNDKLEDAEKKLNRYEKPNIAMCKKCHDIYILTHSDFCAKCRLEGS